MKCEYNIKTMILNFGGYPLGRDEDEFRLIDLGIKEGAVIEVMDDADFKGVNKYSKPDFAPKLKKQLSNYKAIISKQNFDGSYDHNVLPVLGKDIN
jgi:hypothetical protein